MSLNQPLVGSSTTFPSHCLSNASLPPSLKPLGITASALLVSLHEWLKRVFVAQLVQESNSVCDLFCGRGGDCTMWKDVGIGNYMGVDFTASALQDAEEEWERKGKPFPATFVKLDPCMTSICSELPDLQPMDVVRCYTHLQDSFLTEATARQFLANVSDLLKPGGYFFGTCPDSSTIWLKYQKGVESTHSKTSSSSASASGSFHGRAPPSSCVIRTSLYSITFENAAPFDNERGGYFGIKYQLRFGEDDGLPLHSQLMVHFPTLIRLAEAVNLQLVDILNLEEVYEDNRTIFGEELRRRCGVAVDQRGKLVQPAKDLLSLHVAFVFQKTKRLLSG